MRALVFFGDECKLEELAMPVPSEDDVVVRVQAVLLDRSEIIYPVQPDTFDGTTRKSPRWTKRMIPGRFVLGTVVAVGAEIGQSSPSKGSSSKKVTHRSPLAIGMRVMGLMDDKGCAEFTVIHAAFVFPLDYLVRSYPQYLSFTTTALLLAIEDYLTGYLAHYVTFFQAHIAETDTVAVFGADTPFGHALMTTLRRQHIEVIPFTEHPMHQHHLLLTETADDDPDKPQLRYERDPHVFCQADVVLDPYGTAHLPIALTFAKRLGGRILFYDTLHPAAALTPETLQMLYKRSITLQFANIRQLDRPLKHALRRHFDQFLTTTATASVSASATTTGATSTAMASTTTRDLSTVIECAFTLDDIARAFALLEATPATPTTPTDATPMASTEVSAIVVHLNSASTAVMELSQELDVLMHQKLRFTKFPPPTTHDHDDHRSPPDG